MLAVVAYAIYFVWTNPVPDRYSCSVYFGQNICFTNLPPSPPMPPPPSQPSPPPTPFPSPPPVPSPPRAEAFTKTVLEKDCDPLIQMCQRSDNTTSAGLCSDTCYLSSSFEEGCFQDGTCNSLSSGIRCKFKSTCVVDELCITRNRFSATLKGKYPQCMEPPPSPPPPPPPLPPSPPPSPSPPPPDRPAVNGIVLPSPPPPPPPADLVYTNLRKTGPLGDCYYWNTDGCDAKRFPDMCYKTPECFYRIPKNDPCLPPKDVLRTKSIDEAKADLTWATIPCGKQETAYYLLRQAGAQWLYLEVTGAALVLSILLMFAFRPAPISLVYSSHVAFNLTTWACFVGCIAYFAWGWMVLFFFLAVFHSLYLFIGMNKLPDAGLMLDTTVQVLDKFPGLTAIAIAQVLSQVCSFVGWIYLYVTLFGRLGTAVDFVLFFVLMWLGQITRYILHVTIAGVTAIWYFQLREPYPIFFSLLRACTTSLGSITFGSMLMTVSKFVRVIAGFLRNQAKVDAQAFAAVFLVLDGLLGHFNLYGFCYVAIYGLSFINASSKAMKTISHAGIKAMMMDHLIGGASIAGAFFMGMFCMSVAYMLLENDANGALPDDYKGDNVMLVYFPCFFIGWIVGISFLEEAESVSATLYVCFAEEPQVLESTDKELYLDFVDMWYQSQMEDTDQEESEEEEHSISSFEDSDDEREKEKVIREQMEKEERARKKKEYLRDPRSSTGSLGSSFGSKDFSTSFKKNSVAPV